ncbi:MAG: hypothetical protein RDU20_01425 [Desulfomonilaceae bacterium]|nr:hypothetical protein [Desulfomonilaceae bacterium]
MDSIPFLHANQIFNVMFFEDLTFTEVRSILDHLLERNAFDHEVQEIRGQYLIEAEGCDFKVWVAEMDVIIKRD